MKKIRVCVAGYGNVGREALECIKQASDMEPAGVVRRAPGAGSKAGIPHVTCVEELGPVDTAILALPSRLIPAAAPLYLQKGLNTVDSYDIHGEAALSLRNNLGACAREKERVAITGAGWDPGTDSIVRMLFAVIAPAGITCTDFGPGMSMGHGTAARSIPGVKDALSLTLPLGYGRHRRDVYLELEEGADFAGIAARITAADGAVCLLAAVDESAGRSSFLFAAAPNVPNAMNDLLKRSLAPVGGKGGGNAATAQGGAPTTDNDGILATARAILTNEITL